MQRRLIHTKLYYKCFYSVWKDTSHKPSKVVAVKAFLPSVYVIRTAFFDECCLFHVIIGRHYSLYKLIVIQRFSATTMLLRFLKRVHILCPLSPQQYYNAANTKGPKLKTLLFKFPQQILFLRMFTYILSFCVNVSHFSS